MTGEKGMNKCFIIICLKDSTPEDPATYVQTTRKRFTYDDAMARTKSYAPSRYPLVVAVPWVELNKNDYPIYNNP